MAEAEQVVNQTELTQAFGWFARKQIVGTEQAVLGQMELLQVGCWPD